MKQLETLLNVLLKKGWKPWGENAQKVTIKSSEIFVYNFGGFVNPNGKHIRELVSLESGLWQFVCENNMVYSSSFIEWQKWGKQGAVLGLGSIWHKYRLIESALVPEEKLAKFLVDNIKVEGNSR